MKFQRLLLLLFIENRWKMKRLFSLSSVLLLLLSLRAILSTSGSDFNHYQQTASSTFHPNSGTAEYNNPYQSPVQAGQVMHYDQQQVAYPPGHFSFRAIDDLERSQVLQYALDILLKAVAENDVVNKRHKMTSVHDKIFFDDDARDSKPLKIFFEQLQSSNFKVRNLTIIIALVYMDKVAQILHLYASCRSARRLFAACLIIASKMHQNEVSREDVAELLEIPMGDLVNVESAVVLAVRDLTVHPQLLMSYVRPLVGGPAH